MKRKHILYRDVADKLKEDIMSGRYPIGLHFTDGTGLKPPSMSARSLSASHRIVSGR